MSSIDQRIVQMQFENSQFEKGVKESLKTLDDLKDSLEFKDSVKSIEELQRAGNSFSLAKMAESLEAVERRFSALGIAGQEVIRRLTSTVMDAVGKLNNSIKNLTVAQIPSGWNKYAEKTTSMQTIVNATGKSVEYVNEQLERLNWFTDETSYNFTDMVSNIGKFTSMKIPLDKSVTAMQGIATWAAVSGQGVNEASRAMYNLSQAMGVGAVKLMDWKSIQNANMATAEFKETVIATAIAMGKLKQGQVTLNNFDQTLKKGWFTNDVLMAVLEKYGSYANDVYELASKEGISAAQAMDKLGKSTNSLGEKAFRAAQEAKTFKEAIEATTDAVSTGWMNVFEGIFGNYEEAKVLWTDLANALWEVFASPVTGLSDLIKEWRQFEDGFKTIDGRAALIEGVYDAFAALGNIIETVKEAISDIFPPPTVESLINFSNRVKEFGANLKETFNVIEDIKEYDVDMLEQFTELKVGDKSDEVQAIQEQLVALGLLSDKLANGKFAQSTANAVKAFQRLNGLKASGIVDKKTLEALIKSGDTLDEVFDKVVKKGDRNKDVKDVQQRLKNLGYDLGRSGVDSIFGPVTKAAVEKFQKDMGLEITGIVDEATHNALFNKKKSSGNRLEEMFGVQTFEESTKTLSKPLQRLKSIFSGAAAVVDIFRQALSFVGRIAGHIGELLKPFGDAIFAVAAAVGDALVSFDEWLKTSGIFDKWFGSVKKALEPVGKWFKEAAKSILDFFGIVDDGEGKHFRSAMMTFPALWENIKKSLNKSEVFKKISKAFRSLRKSIENVKEPLKKAWKQFKEAFGEGFQKLIGGASDGLETAGNWLVDFVTGGLEKVSEWVGKAPEVIDKLKEFWNALTYEGDATSGKKPGFLIRLRNAFKSVIDFLFGEGDVIKGKKPGVFRKLWALIRGDMDVFTEGMSEEEKKNALEKIQAVKDFFDNIGDAISLLFTNTISKASKLPENIQNGIKNFRNWITSFFNEVRLLITGNIEKAKESGIGDKAINRFLEIRDGISQVFTTIVGAFRGAFDFIGGLLRGEISFDSPIAFLQSLWEKVTKFFNDLGDGIGKIFGDFWASIAKLFGEETVNEEEKKQVVSKVKKTTALLTGDVEALAEETTEKDKVTIFDRILSVKDFFDNIGDAISLLFTNTISKASKLPKGIQSGIKKFRDWIINFYHEVRLLITGNEEEAKEANISEDKIKRVIQIRDGIIKVFNTISGAVKSIAEGIRKLISGETKLNFDSPIAFLQSLWESIGSFFGQLGEGIDKIFGGIGGVLNRAWMMVSNVVKWIWDRKWLILFGAALIGLINVIYNFGGTFRKLQATIKSFRKDSQPLSKSLLQFAGSIAIIAGSLLVIASIPEKNFNQAITGLIGIFAGIVVLLGLIKAFIKTDDAKNIEKAGKAVLDIGITIAIISGLALVLGTPELWDRLISGLGKLIVIAVLLGGYLHMINKIDLKVKGLWEIAIVIGAMSLIAYELGRIDNKDAIWSGIARLGALMLELGIFTAFIGKLGGGKIKLKGLIGLSILIGVMAVVINQLGNITDQKVLIRGGIALAAMLGFITLISAIFAHSRKEMRMGPIISMFLGITVAVAAMSTALIILGGMPKKMLKKGLIALTGIALILIGLGVVFAVINKVGKGKNSRSKSSIKNIVKGVIAIVSSLITIIAVVGILIGVLGAIDDSTGGKITDALKSGGAVLSELFKAMGTLSENMTALGAIVALLAGGVALGVKGTKGMGKEIMKGTASLAAAFDILILDLVVLVGGIGKLKDVPGLDVEGSVQAGGRIISSLFAPIRDFKDNLSLLVPIFGALAFGTIVQHFGLSKDLIYGTLALVAALDILVVDLTILIGGIGKLKDIPGLDVEGSVETGVKIISTLFKPISTLSDNLKILVPIFGALAFGTIVQHFGLSKDLIYGTLALVAALDLLVVCLTFLVAGLGKLNQITEGDFINSIYDGAEVLNSLGYALGSLKTGFETAENEGIKGFGEAMESLTTAIDGLGTDEEIDQDLEKAQGIAEKIHEFFGGLEAYPINNDTIFVEYATAASELSTDIAEYGGGISDLWDGIKGLSKDKDIENDTDESIKIATKLKEFFDKIADQENWPDGAGLEGYNKHLDSLFTHIKTLGTTMGRYRRRIKGLAESTISEDSDKAIEVTTELANFLKDIRVNYNDIEKNKGYLDKFFNGDTVANTIIESFKTLGTSVAIASEGMKGVGGPFSTFENDVKVSLRAVANVASTISEVFKDSELNLTTPDYGDKLLIEEQFDAASTYMIELADNVKQFNDKIGEYGDLSKAESFSNILENIRNFFSGDTSFEISSHSFVDQLDATFIIDAIDTFATSIGNKIDVVTNELNTKIHALAELFRFKPDAESAEGMSDVEYQALSAGFSSEEIKSIVNRDTDYSGLQVIGSDMATEIVNGMANGDTSGVSAFIQSLKDAIKAYYDEFVEVGKYLDEGLAKGITDGKAPVVEAAKTLMELALQALRDAGLIRSPSKKTYEIGEYYTEGFVNAVTDNTSKAESASATLVKKANSSVEKEAKSKSTKKAAKQYTETVADEISSNGGAVQQAVAAMVGSGVESALDSDYAKGVAEATGLDLTNVKKTVGDFNTIVSGTSEEKWGVFSAIADSLGFGDKLKEAGVNLDFFSKIMSGDMEAAGTVAKAFGIDLGDVSTNLELLQKLISGDMSGASGLMASFGMDLGETNELISMFSTLTSEDGTEGLDAFSASLQQADENAKALQETLSNFSDSDTIGLGSEIEAVESLQKILADSGYLSSGLVNGKYGKSMENAVRHFQKAKGLKITGVIDKTTLTALAEAGGLYDSIDESVITTVADVEEKLNPAFEQTVSQAAVLASNLKIGSSGKAVKRLQQNLMKMGYKLDQYGADGIFGPETQRAINEFKTQYGLAVDGVYDDVTKSTLETAISNVDGSGVGTKIADTVNDGVSEGNADGIKIFAKNLLHTLEGYYEDFQSMGVYLDEGLAHGIIEGQTAVINAAQIVMELALQALRDAGLIRSPSRKSYEIGEYVTEGFANGMLDSLGLAENAGEEEIKAAMLAMSKQIEKEKGVSLDFSGLTSGAKEFNEELRAIYVPNYLSDQEIVDLDKQFDQKKLSKVGQYFEVMNSIIESKLRSFLSSNTTLEKKDRESIDWVGTKMTSAIAHLVGSDTVQKRIAAYAGQKALDNFVDGFFGQFQITALAENVDKIESDSSKPSFYELLTKKIIEETNYSNAMFNPIINAGAQLAEQFYGGFSDDSSNTKEDAANEAATGLTATMSEHDSEFNDIGTMLVGCFAQGFRSGMLTEFASIETELTERIQGLKATITTETEDMFNGTEPSNNSMSLLSNIATALDEDFDYEPVIRPVVDLSDTRKAASSIDSLFSTKSFSVEATKLAGHISEDRESAKHSSNQNDTRNYGRTTNNNVNAGVTLTGNTFNVRKDSDVEALAKEIASIAYNQQRSLGVTLRR